MNTVSGWEALAFGAIAYAFGYLWGRWLLRRGA